MTTAFEVGAVLHWSGFEFEDGSTKNKYFVVLGAKPESDCLVVIATSRPKDRSYSPGCHQNEGYYHIPGGGKDFFPEDTWLLLMECRAMGLAEVLKAAMARELTVSGKLRTEIANAIRNCLKRIDDISPVQIALL